MLIWLGGIESAGGYGRFRSETLGVVATHRWSALAHYGAVSEPVVRYRCDVRCCVRPDHVVVGTQAQNIADTVRRGRWTSHARTGPRQWPALAYALRTAARARDDEPVAELLRRPCQLALWADLSGHPADDARSPVAPSVSVVGRLDHFVIIDTRCAGVSAGPREQQVDLGTDVGGQVVSPTMD